ARRGPRRRARRIGAPGYDAAGPAGAAAPASAASRRGGARPREIAGQKVRGGARVLGCTRRVLLCKVGREALVEEQNRHVELLAERGGKVLRRPCLLAALAAKPQR